jgi:signal transduction histidine kinase
MISPEIVKLRESLKSIADPTGFLANLFAYSPVGFSIWTADGHCLFTNQAYRDLFGSELPPEYNILHDDVVDEMSILQNIRRAFSGQAVQLPAFWYDLRDLKSVKVTEGNRVAISMAIFPLFDAQGAIEFVACTYKDETEVMLAHDWLKLQGELLEQRVAERTVQLAGLNRELEAFTYSVSHDLRGPVRSIDGFAAILAEELSVHQVSDATRENLSRIRSAARRMGQLIDDLLAFSKLGSQPLHTRTVSTEHLLQQVLEDLSEARAGRNVEIVLGAMPSCEADPSMLRQVFVNLLANALKFTRQRAAARIEVGCHDAGGEHIWCVKDNGIGFDMQHAGKLFEMFERLHAELTTKGRE